MSVLTTTPLKSWPPAAAALSLPVGTGAGAALWSAWTEVVAATAAPTSLAGFLTKVTSIADYEVELASGAVGAEQSLGNFYFGWAESPSNALSLGMLPIPVAPVPTGTRLSARARTTVANVETMGFSFLYYENLDSDYVAAGKYTYLPELVGAGFGVTQVASTTAWANVPYSDLATSLLFDAYILGIAFSSSITDNFSVEVDLASGPIGAETVLTTLALCARATGLTHVWLPAPLPVTAGTRISFRTRSPNTTASRAYKATLLLLTKPGVSSAPSAHHATHETGGADAITALSGAVITSGTVADARLSSNVVLKPVPIADGGTGVTTGLTQLSASNLTSGAVPDARLSSNVALRNAINTFALQNDFNGLVRALSQMIVRDFLQLDSTGTPSFVIAASAAGADLKNWQTIANPADGQYYIRALNDAASVIQGTPLALARNGSVAIGNALYERARTFPMGEWVAYTPSFSASGGAWTVEAGDLVNARYMLIGKTCFLVISIDNSSLAVDSVLLYASLPVTPARQHRAMCQTNDATGYAVGVAYTLPANATLSIGKYNFGAFIASTNVLHIHLSLCFEIQ